MSTSSLCLCPRAASVWRTIGINANTANFRHPKCLWSEPYLPDQVRTYVTLLILWHIWKSRNALIFDHVSIPAQETIRRNAQETIRRTVTAMEQWNGRYRRLTPQWEVWADFLRSRL
ncbi:hypothetical protein HU200_041566 [Digitaria exilis]|uniref:Uncharacterized protein n=1 Tax=Digitaria exilis TaxID=1010633 RepID=A0A835EJ48_9POAL|nr:hypothetical protein HU200_041566 [Digitaria exilis]